MKKYSLLFASALTLLSLTACGGKKADSSAEQFGASKEETQLVFEENYIKDKYNYANGGQFVVSIIGNLGSIAAGVGFDSPTAVVSGVFGLLNNIGGQFAGSNGPTTKDVMNKLNEMDAKLDMINATLTENYNQLMSEEIRTQAMVDKVLLEGQEAAIASFYTDYALPIENFERNYSDYVEQSLKAFVGGKEDVTFYVHKDENKKWTLNSLMDLDKEDRYEISISIEDFPRSAEFLAKNYNTVSEGFMDNFYADLDDGIANTVLPEGLEKEDCRNFLAGNIVENITKNYYVDNHDKALEIRNDVINFAKQISGKAGKSILNKYVERMEYMYNFAGEIKNTVTDLFSNIKQTLKTNAALAAQACVFANVNQDEIRNELVAAEDVIRNKYAAIKDIKDNYCYLTNTCLGGGFYRAKFNTWYTNKGNSCGFHAEFELDKVIGTTGAVLEKDDVTKHNYANEIDHLRIVARMNLMRELGLVNPNSYIEYLVGAKIINAADYNNFKVLRDRKWLTDDALRFFTGLTVRGMNDSDKNFTLTCNEAGNPDGDYFNVGWTGTFRSSRDSGCWEGKIAETTYVDATNGTIMKDKRVAAYATYAESHYYWIDDEYWSFLDNTAGNYFFTLEHVAA